MQITITGKSNMTILHALEWAAECIKRDDGGDTDTATGWASDEALEAWLVVREIAAAAAKTVVAEN